MRSISLFGLTVWACLTLTMVDKAAAESPLEGPLATPSVARPAKPAAIKSAKAKPARKKTAKSAKKPASTAYGQGFDPASLPDARPTGQAGARTLDDPVSFGMKWSGSSDSARDTRVQNYNGDAAGTGAEVGMKLHF